MSIVIISCGGCKGAKVATQANSISKEKDSLSKASDDVNKSISSSEFDLGILKDAPMLPLEDADIKEVYDHYILQDTSNSYKYHIYDGVRQQVVEISPDEKFEISGNQKFMVRTLVKGNRLAKQHFLDITMLNTSNEVLYKGIIPAIGEDNYESHDYVYPLNTGKGIVIHSEEANILTLFIIQNSKLREVGKIKKKETIIVGFKMTDDGSDIICLDYNEELGQYTLSNYGLRQDKLSLKWEKKLIKPDYEFSRYGGYRNYYLDENKLINLRNSQNGMNPGIEIYNLSGDLVVDRNTSNRLYYESYIEDNKVTYIGTADKYIEYLNIDGKLQTLNLSDIFKTDTSLNIRPFKLINNKDNILLEFILIPNNYTHKDYITGILSGLAILSKDNLSKGKFYHLYNKNTCTIKIIDDSVYFLKGWSSQFPNTVKKTGFPISD